MSAEIIQLSSLQAKRLAAIVGNHPTRTVNIVPVISSGWHGLATAKAGFTEVFRIKDSLTVAEQLRCFHLLEQALKRCPPTEAGVFTQVTLWADWKVTIGFNGATEPQPGQVIQFKKKA